MSESPRARIVGLLTRPEPALILAPMATLTHAGLRTLVAEYGGCDLFFSEMISAEALVGGSQYTAYYLATEPDPARLVFQLVGYSEDRLVAAAKRLAQTGAAGVDLNMGCSAPHIVRKGGGIAWMSDHERAEHLVRSVRAVLEDKTLSVKLRLGRDDDPRSLLDLCRKMEDAGADFVTLHPKRQKEGSARRARWSFVAMLREQLSIPVVGSGGITGYEAYASRLRQGGTGPVMVGRAAARAPWIFAYLARRRRGGADEMQIDLREAAERFFALLERYQPRDFWPTRTRRFLSYLVSNLAFGHSLGARLAQERSYARAREALFAYFDAHPEADRHVERG